MSRYPFNTGPTPDNPWPMTSGQPDGPPQWRGGIPKGGVIMVNGAVLSSHRTRHRRSQRKYAKLRGDYDGTLELVLGGGE